MSYSLSSFEEKRVSCTVQDGATTRTYQGTLKTAMDRDMEGVGKIDRYIASLYPANSKQQNSKEKCTIKLDVSKEGKVVRSDIKHADDTYCGTKIQLNSGDEGRRKGTTKVKCKGMKKAEMHLVTYEDGTEIQRDQGNWESCSAKRGESQIGLWEVAPLSTMSPESWQPEPSNADQVLHRESSAGGHLCRVRVDGLGEGW